MEFEEPKGWKYLGKRYWAEVRLEVPEGFYYLHACGQTKKELMEMIQARFDKNAGRDPSIALALFDPAGKKKDITDPVIKEFNKRRENGTI